MTEPSGSESRSRRPGWEGGGVDNPAMDNSTTPSRQSGYLDDEIGPAENDMYESSVHVQSDAAPPPVDVSERPSVFEKFSRGVRCKYKDAIATFMIKFMISLGSNLTFSKLTFSRSEC